MSKLTELELLKLQEIEAREQVISKDLELLRKDVTIIDYKIDGLGLRAKLLEKEKAEKRQAVSSAELRKEDAVKTRRELLQSYAKKYKIKSDTWGYDPETGEIHRGE